MGASMRPSDITDGNMSDAVVEHRDHHADASMRPSDITDGNTVDTRLRG